MSTLRVTTITNPSGGQPTIDGLAKAWVNFNGTGTVAIRASLNVSSITDNGTGDYTVNFTTAMVDANYASAFSLATTYNTGDLMTQLTTSPASATGVRISSVRTGVGAIDVALITAAVFR